MKKIKLKKANLLIHEKSPYLLQHAYNPIKWFPWGEKSFTKAHKENKPIFLSIGYSTCHWCHVMEKESFEDKEVAKLLNEIFICIKVDREERPDIDNLYMTVCQLMTGNGGWPLTIIMTPDKKPFFAATYIPKENKLGRIGLMNLIPQIKEMWQKQQNKIRYTVNQVAIALEHISHSVDDGRPDEKVLNATFRKLEQHFDEEFGGFGDSTKFPTPHNLMFLLRYWHRYHDEKALQMVTKSLSAMRHGGIFDHTGYGFHRYSTDRRWLLPHFEKMLYDQALIVIAYIEAYQVTRNAEYKDTAQAIFDYVLKNMISSEGGFYSAEDADSEGEEGKFYVWSYDEIKKVLGREAEFFIKVYNIKKEGNYKEESTGEKTKKNILYSEKDLLTKARELGIKRPLFFKRIERLRKRLLKIREERTRPNKDDKILTDWNGLMIAALAKGARIFGKSKYVRTTTHAAQFILNKMRDKKARLLHRFIDDEAAVHANLDDYAFLIWGLIELYETTFNVGYLKSALKLNDDLIERFLDKNNGGFYFTPDDGEHLMIRQKLIADSAIPSGNAVAMFNLLRFSRITGNPEFEEICSKIASVFSDRARRHPLAHVHFTSAVDYLIGHHYEVLIVGKRKAQDTHKMLQATRRHFLPFATVLFRPSDQQQPEITEIAPYTKEQIPLNNKATAYVCTENGCKAPTNDVNTLIKTLDASRK